MADVAKTINCNVHNVRHPRQYFEDRKTADHPCSCKKLANLVQYMRMRCTVVLISAAGDGCSLSLLI